LAFAILCLAALAACRGGENPGDTAGNYSADPGPVSHGGRIVEAMLGEPDNLIPPLSSSGASHQVSELIYVAPLRYNKNLELEAWAAESFEVLEEGRLLRFKLREDIRWFDGEPLTADDVEFTYQLMIDPETPTPYAEDYLAVASFNKTGRYAFEVRYDQPFARALVTWAHAILPEHALKGQDLLTTPLSRDPLGAGPYKLKQWDAGNKLVLTANHDYFLGRPHIEEVVLRIIPDQATQFLELKAGNLDIMDLTPQQHLIQTVGEFWENNYNKYKYLSFGYTYLGFNLRRKKFQDVRVRRAFSYAIDKDELVKGVLLGLGEPALGPYKPGTWVYNDELEPYGYQPDKARALLAEAGWTDSDGDGIRDKDGEPFEFAILTNQGNNQRIKTATIIQRRLADVGIKAHVRTIEWAAFLKEFINKGRFDAALLGWNILQDPDLYDVWHSSKAEPGGLNFIAYKNAELDALLEEGRRTVERPVREKIYRRVQEILHQDQPYVFLFVPDALPIVQARVQNIHPAPAGISYNFTEWWIPKKWRHRRQPNLVQ
jgi:peptide/nickel transport system substrate-binding protein